MWRPARRMASATLATVSKFWPPPVTAGKSEKAVSKEDERVDRHDPAATRAAIGEAGSSRRGRARGACRVVPTRWSIVRGRRPGSVATAHPVAAREPDDRTDRPQRFGQEHL